MILPLLADAGPSAAALGVALAVGMAFGACLERAGLGSATKLAGQFYGRDFTVLKVMFSAIVTAALGVFWLTRLGMLDASQVYVPGTFLLPQAIGGALFGVGLVAAGLCPGTSCVAAASGRRDGVAVLGGMMAGVLLFVLAFPLVAGFYGSTPRGVMTVPALLGISPSVATAGLVALALGAFAGVARWERRGVAAGDA
ncbi:MAG TPA: YeeE/YedE thiosulfate transporter family protein [Longimicrobium sp.]|nr:YeeE/YedE thiosulfate transporter family protein [Longimicrobium sp.]